MKAKVQTIIDGKVRNHRGFFDAKTWINQRIIFLMDICRCDGYKLTQNGDVFTLKAWRKAGKRGKAIDVTHIITVIE